MHYNDWCLDYLHSQFFDDTHYGINHNKINYIYAINGRNFNQTWIDLQKDEYVRWMIGELHKMKNSMDGSKLQAQRQNLISQIDELVEERNSHLSRIDEISEAKVFDLHWFSLNGALKFVRKIQKAMENSSKRFSQRQEVTLITGWNNRIPWNTSIKTTLLDIYGDAIRVAENNPGRLIWSFEKKWTYADHLF